MWYERNRAWRFVVAVCLGFLFLPSLVGATDELALFRPADTSSPQATLESFIDACNELHKRIQKEKYLDRTASETRLIARRIVDCLDTSELPEYAREELAGEAATCLKEILDRVELPPFEKIPNDEAVQVAGGMETIPRWQIPGTRITISRVEEGAQRNEYLFSSGTVGRAIDYYEDMKHLPYRAAGPEISEGLHRWYFSAPGHPMVSAFVDRLPEWTRERKLGLTIWKWPGILLLLSISVLLMVAAYRFYRVLAPRWRQKGLFLSWLVLVFPIAAMLVPLGFTYVTENFLTVRGTPLYVASFVANLATFLASIAVVVGISNRMADTVIASPRIQSEGLDAQFIRIISKLLALVAIVIVFLEGGRYLGIPITTLLAGAGIGGLAIALAAQGTLKDLLGTMTILLDKPYRVGERIIVKDYDGVVDEIGLRSTKICLLTGPVVSVPNDVMAESEIENVGRRPYIRRAVTIELPSDTAPAKIKRALKILRKILRNHEGMKPEYPPRVYLRDVNQGSIGIFMIYWFHPPEYWDFLAFSERVTLEMSEKFEAEGIAFAAPALTVRVPPDEKAQKLH